ncbi:MAG TPA: decarboxylating 6-phosphogluconate dehydrogenase [Patescibacteria group bacterium]|jgi:6-phosphogluconate dehydrogenase|nr:decarboxylating 6-phosphogluconate dehydrogenase [Patescibacteria group bacterium]
MDIGIIGLGRMGAAVAIRLVKNGFSVHGYDTNQEHYHTFKAQSIQTHKSLADIAAVSNVIWLMVPAGTLIDTIIGEIIPHLKKNSIVVDAGNSHFKDASRRAHILNHHEHEFVDCGTSGGVHGLKHGFCLMIGATVKTFALLEPFFKAIACPNGYAHVGPIGSGHLVKMVHNGIEYGIMQAYAEGLDLLKHTTIAEHHINLAQITKLWQSGSVIRSWLLELTHHIFIEHGQELNTISGKAASSGMGQWTVDTAHEMHVAVPVIKKSLEVRKESLQTGGTYATKLVALMRNQFGGHAIYKEEK